MEISESESVILSAYNNSGVFGNRSEILQKSNKHIILHDGNFIYPLGNCSHINKLPQIKHNGILGKETNVQKIISLLKEDSYLEMHKNYAKLDPSSRPIAPKIPDKISIAVVKTEEQLEAFSLLKNEFLHEESGEDFDEHKTIDSLKIPSLKIHPSLIQYKNKSIGMISSNFNSPESAMINMLYINRNNRKKGYGKLLITWYIKYLMKLSQNIYLFYSPENNAQKIYQQLNFKNIDQWIMATKLNH